MSNIIQPLVIFAYLSLFVSRSLSPNLKPPDQLTTTDQGLKWIVQCYKDVYQNSRFRLEYAYLLLDKFIMNRINSELIKIGRILTSFSVTESSCDDTSRANKKNPRSNFREIRERILSSF